MKYELGALHGAAKYIGIEQVAMFQAEARRAQRRRQKLDLPRGEIIEASDLMSTGEQTIHQVAADETGRTGYQDSHGFFLISLWIRRMRKMSIAFRRFPLTSASRLSPSSRQRMGTC